MSCDIKRLAEKISFGNAVFFGGAGVSTESGIPDFRSAGGLYNSSGNDKPGYSPEDMLSRTFFEAYTGEFFGYYKSNLIYPDAKPNKAHLSLAKLEKAGYLNAVITQNVDGLHQRAGSDNVIELHGNSGRNICMKCGTMFCVDYILNSNGIPYCECGGIVKPDVVLYEESLDEAVVESAIRCIKSAETLIIGGTSLVVYPASMYITFFRGSTIALINKASTPFDSNADILIKDKIGDVLDEVCVELGL